MEFNDSSSKQERKPESKKARKKDRKKEKKKKKKEKKPNVLYGQQILLLSAGDLYAPRLLHYGYHPTTDNSNVNTKQIYFLANDVYFV